MTQANPIRVAIAGEALIDLISEADGRFNPCLGGAVYNLARALARQGLGTLYLNPFSGDVLGQDLMRQMVSDGVQLAQPAPVQAVTSLAVVHVDAHGHPHYAFYREGVADRQVSAAQMRADCAAHPQLSLVCTGALALDARDQAIYLPWIQAQKALGKTVVVDANLRPSVMPDLSAYRECVHAYLALADIIKVSDEDLQALGVPGDTPLEQARHLRQHSSAKIIALTLGADGAWLLSASAGECFAQETAALHIVDTVGAGDSFLAGLLAALCQFSDDETNVAHAIAHISTAKAQLTLRHAIASASLCVQARGCVPPTWAQAASWAAKHPAVSST